MKIRFILLVCALMGLQDAAHAQVPERRHQFSVGYGLLDLNRLEEDTELIHLFNFDAAQMEGYNGSFFANYQYSRSRWGFGLSLFYREFDMVKRDGSFVAFQNNFRFIGALSQVSYAWYKGLDWTLSSSVEWGGRYRTAQYRPFDQMSSMENSVEFSYQITPLVVSTGLGPVRANVYVGYGHLAMLGISLGYQF